MISKAIGMVAVAVVMAGVVAACGGAVEKTDSGRSGVVENPKECRVAILCEQGTFPTDSDGDGCEDTCEPKACPAVMFDCAKGSAPADADGDGCIDSCAPIGCPRIALLCVSGEVPTDADGDGCEDSCAPPK